MADETDLATEREETYRAAAPADAGGCPGPADRRPVGGDAGARLDRVPAFANPQGHAQRHHRRLSGVVIECLPYGEFITRYARPETLFYLDPPYWGCEGDYGRVLFERSAARMADLLSGIQGRFILSLNDRPQVRDIFSAFDIEAAQTSYSVSRKVESRGVVGEVLITGGNGGR